MGTDVAEVVESSPYPYSFKVHHVMCTELRKLVEKVLRIFPEIEAARPRCSSGIQSLCFLNQAVEKAKLLLQHCSEASKFYLALTGDATLSRCQKSRKLLEQSLAQIQNMVPVMLAIEISQIIGELRSVTFILDSDEEEVGRVVRKLFQKGASTSNALDNSEITALKFAASRLHITSPKAILIEKRSIKKLLDKVSKNDQTKITVLKYLLHLLEKHGNSIIGEHVDRACNNRAGSLEIQDRCKYDWRNQSAELKPCMDGRQYEHLGVEIGRPIPPEEFKCPVSLRLMYDPVVIASGQTYERMWIEKWFDDGNDKCPKTKSKLSNLSLTPNAIMKDLISKWCARHGVANPDPSVQPEVLHPWEASSTSISSLGSSMNDLHLQVDLSNMSIGSLDGISDSDLSRTRSAGLDMMITRAYGDSNGRQSHPDVHNIDPVPLSRLSGLQLNSQCQLIEDMKQHLESNEQAFRSLSLENYVEPLIKFLRTAYDLGDLKAERAAIQLLLEFVSICRNGLSCLNEEAFNTLATFFDSEIREEALDVVEILSENQYCRAKIAASGALKSILKILNSHGSKAQQQAVKILHNLSLIGENCSLMISLDCIPKLLPLLNDSTLVRECLRIMKNMCNTEAGMVSIAETKGCIPSIAKILDNGSQEDQECAVAVLLSFCSQRDLYCHLVLAEGVMPSLDFISANGNDSSKVYALELLRILRDCDYAEDVQTVQDSKNVSKETKSSSKASGIQGKKMSMFSRSGYPRERRDERVKPCACFNSY